MLTSSSALAVGTGNTTTDKTRVHPSRSVIALRTMMLRDSLSCMRSPRSRSSIRASVVVMTICAVLLTSCPGSKPSPSSSASPVPSALIGRSIWVATEGDQALQRIDLGLRKASPTFPLSGTPRSILRDGTGFLVPLGARWAIADFDPKTATTRSTITLPTEPVESSIKRSYPKAGKISTIDALALVRFRKSLVVVGFIQTSNIELGVLYWTDSKKVVVLPAAPERAIVVGDQIFVSLIGSDRLAVYDATLKYVRVGSAPRDLLSVGDRIYASLTEGGDVAVIDPALLKVVGRIPIPWPRPSGLARWNDVILVVAEGTIRSPKGALVFYARDGTTKLELNVTHPQDIAILGDYAVITSVDEDLAVVFDLTHRREIGRIHTGDYPSSPIVV